MNCRQCDSEAVYVTTFCEIPMCKTHAIEAYHYDGMDVMEA